MLSGGAPERALLDTNVASYNSLFHVAVAALNVVVPIDAAGKIVIAIYFVLVAAGTLALLRATGRPRNRAFLIFPVLCGYCLAWGFVNFLLGVAIQLFALARVLDRPKLEPRRAIRFDLVTCAIAIVGVWAHLLGSALVYMLMLVAIVVGVQTDAAPFWTRIGRAIRRGAPLIPAIGYAAFVYRRQEASSFRIYEYQQYEGNDDFALTKVKLFLDRATGIRLDGLDAKILGVALGLLVLGALLRDPDDERPPVLPWLCVIAFIAYLVIPHVFWATNFVYERVTFIVMLTALLWIPRALPKYEWLLRFMYVSVGLAAAVSFWSAMGAAGQETADFDRILDEAPKGRKVTGLIWYPKTPSSAQWSMLHSAAYYVARNGGEVAFSFMRTMSLPVHYRPETMPPVPPTNFEWRPSEFDPDAAYARYFDLIVAKTTYDDGKDPRASIWHERADQVKVLAHHGNWWLLDAADVKHVDLDFWDDKPFEGKDDEKGPE
jgi:hypothetical protein